ncbi:MAG: penicillin-binding protein activator [Desulfobaccales bacterium]
MKISLPRLSALFLLLWLLPACAELPGPPSPRRPLATVVTDESLFQAAEADYHRQAYAQAYQGYSQYLQRYPQGPHAFEARLREAELLGLKGDWQGALALYQGILAQQPEPSVALKARYGIGQAYYRLGQFQEANQTLDSLTAAPNLPRSLWFSTQALLAEIALRQGNVPDAFSRLRLAAQDLSSGDREWFEDLKTRVVEAASIQDLESLANLYRENPLSAALVLRLARLSQQAGQSGETRKWVKLLQERYPDSPEAKAGQALLAGAPSGKITLGCLLPLSGDLSNIGYRVQRGMELAAQQAPVDLIFKDTPNDPDTVRQQVQGLAQDPRVLAILGPLSAGIAQPAAAAAQNAGVPLVALSQKGDLTQTGNMIFDAFLIPSQQAQALVRRCTEMGLQRFAILYPDSAYGRAFLEAFQKELAAAGLGLAAQEMYTPGTQDFTQELTSLKEALSAQGPETVPATALFIPDDVMAVSAIAGQLAESPLAGVQLLGTNLLHNPGITPEQAAALKGVWFSDAFFEGDPNPAVQAFVGNYRQKYGETPDYLAAQGYLLVRLFGRLAKSGGPLSRADLASKLSSLKADPDLPWFRGFNRQGEEEAAIYLLTFQDGRVQMLPPPAPAPASE